MGVHFFLFFSARSCKMEGKQTVRCQFVLKLKKEQLQGTVRETVNRKVATFFSSRQKIMLSDLAAVFASCSPDMCCTAGVQPGFKKKKKKTERLE